MKKIYQKGELILKAKNLFAEERKIDRLDGWFIAKEIEMNSACKYNDCSDEVKKAITHDKKASADTCSVVFVSEIGNGVIEEWSMNAVLDRLERE